MKYKIMNVLNNNVVIIETDNGRQFIFIGSGVGFKEKKGNAFSALDRVDQSFEIKDSINQKNFTEMVTKENPSIVAFTEEKIGQIQHAILDELNESIHITLPDHLAFALERSKNGMGFHNPYNYSISLMYKEEYDLAKMVVSEFNEQFDANLNDDEIGIVAMHIHAAKKHVSLSEQRRKASLCSELIDDIMKVFPIDGSNDTLNYQRLLTHVSFAIERIRNNESADNEILDLIKEKYSNEFCILKKITDEFARKNELQISDSEVSYLVLYIKRLMN